MATTIKSVSKKNAPKKAIKKKGDPCWDGYEQVGTKKKEGQKVPDCVPDK